MMSTTRKDLYRIADALAESHPARSRYPDNPETSARCAQWRQDVDRIADALTVTTGYTPNGNRSFDRDRFLKACGVTV
jgi:glutathione S-transferase